jgi:hypothetical protein
MNETGPNDSRVVWAPGKFFFYLCFSFFQLTYGFFIYRFYLCYNGPTSLAATTAPATHRCEPLLAGWISGARRRTRGQQRQEPGRTTGDDGDEGGDEGTRGRRTGTGTRTTTGRRQAGGGTQRPTTATGPPSHVRGGGVIFFFKFN